MKLTVLQQMILVNCWKAIAFVQVLILMKITWAYFLNWIQKKIAFSLQEEVHFQDAKTTAIGVKSRFYKRRGTLFISLLSWLAVKICRLAVELLSPYQNKSQDF